MSYEVSREAEEEEQQPVLQVVTTAPVQFYCSTYMYIFLDNK